MTDASEQSVAVASHGDKGTDLHARHRALEKTIQSERRLQR